MTFDAFIDTWCLVEISKFGSLGFLKNSHEIGTVLSWTPSNCSHRLWVDFCVVLFILFAVSLHVWQVWQNAIVMHRASTAHACPNSPIFPQCLHLFLIMIEKNSQICVKIVIHLYMVESNLEYTYNWDLIHIVFFPKCSWGVLLSCLDRFIKFWLSKKW